MWRRFCPVPRWDFVRDRAACRHRRGRARCRRRTVNTIAATAPATPRAGTGKPSSPMSTRAAAACTPRPTKPRSRSSRRAFFRKKSSPPWTPCSTGSSRWRTTFVNSKRRSQSTSGRRSRWCATLAARRIFSRWRRWRITCVRKSSARGMKCWSRRCAGPRACGRSCKWAWFQCSWTWTWRRWTWIWTTWKRESQTRRGACSRCTSSATCAIWTGWWIFVPVATCSSLKTRANRWGARTAGSAWGRLGVLARTVFTFPTTSPRAKVEWSCVRLKKTPISSDVCARTAGRASFLTKTSYTNKTRT